MADCSLVTQHPQTPSNPQVAATQIPAIDPAFVPNQWRLALAQLLSGIGVASGVAVNAVLIEEISGDTGLAGFAQTATVLGAAVLALPLARLALARGRRISLGLGFGIGVLAALLVILGVQTRQVVVQFAGLFLFGSATASGLQSRYAAVDLAPPNQRARSMSIVIWATTIGSVAGPQLSAPGAALGRALGLNHLVGPYLFSLVSFALAALVVLSMRRPRVALGAEHQHVAKVSMARALAIAWSRPWLFFGMAAVVTGQMMMTSVMVMTPLHMHHHQMGLEVVGIVISGHILGMYGLSPVVGWLADRIGPAPVVLVGMGLFTLAFAGGIWDAATHSTLSRLIPTLFLLGLGWSCTLIAGSTLVTRDFEPAVRTSMQGTVDTLMNLCAAAITALSGAVLAHWGFVGINVMATMVLVLLGLVGVRALARRTPSGNA